METEPKRDLILPASILIAALIIAGAVYSKGKTPDTGNNSGGNTATSTALNIPPVGSADAVLGSANAPVTFIEYGDYQCPVCGAFFSSVEPKLRQDYVNSGKVKFVFRNFAFIDTFPGAQFNESHLSAEAAACAKDQGKFWEYHDAIYAAEVKDGKENNGNLNRTFFLQLARQSGVPDIGAFTQCIDSRKNKDLINAQSAASEAAGVDRTPMSFINGKQIIGLAAYSTFSSAIDAALQGK